MSENKDIFFLFDLEPQDLEYWKKSGMLGRVGLSFFRTYQTLAFEGVRKLIREANKTLNDESWKSAGLKIKFVDDKKKGTHLLITGDDLPNDVIADFKSNIIKPILKVFKMESSGYDVEKKAPSKFKRAWQSIKRRFPKANMITTNLFEACVTFGVRMKLQYDVGGKVGSISTIPENS